jgi:peroxiredoxin
MAVEIGDLAPDFTLPDENNEKWMLSEHRGRNVDLVFYPLPFSAICTRELHELTDTRDKFDAAGAEIVGISVDSRHVQKLQATLLADFLPRGEVAQKYGVFIEQAGIANRGTFVIDRDGKVAPKVITSIGEARDPNEYLKALEACPA